MLLLQFCVFKYFFQLQFAGTLTKLSKEPNTVYCLKLLNNELIGFTGIMYATL